MKLTPDQIAIINEDFPPEALSSDNSRGFELTSIKAAFVIERLNDVFGHLGWGYEFTDPTWHDGECVTTVTLNINADDGNGHPIPMHEISQFGGKKIVKSNVTDACKSAVTDGLTKCASILGIGHNVFKGMVKSGDKPEKKAKPKPAAKHKLEALPHPGDLATEAQVKKLNVMIKEANLDNIKVKLMLKVASKKDLTKARASDIMERWPDFCEQYDKAQGAQ